MKTSEFNAIIQKRGNRTIFWGYIILSIIAVLIISVLLLVKIDGISLGSLILKNLF